MPGIRNGGLKYEWDLMENNSCQNYDFRLMKKNSCEFSFSWGMNLRVLADKKLDDTHSILFFWLAKIILFLSSIT